MTRFSFLRSPAAGTGLAAAMLAAAPAFAEQANIKSMSFDTEGYYAQIHVISTDGTKWNKLKSGSVAFSGDMHLDTRWPGYVGEVAIVLGSCGPGQCWAYPKIWNGLADSRDYDHTEIVGFNTSIIPISTDGIAIVPHGDQILARCNEHLQADGPTRSYSFSHTFNATFAAETGKILDMDNTIYEAHAEPLHTIDESHTAHGTFQVAVTCDPVIKSPTDDVAVDFGDFDVTGVKLFLTTFQPGHPGSNPGTVCPGFRVISRAQANQAGPVTMRLWRQKDGGPITSEVQQAWASYDAGKNGYFATWEKWEDVGTTSWYQFRTEIVDDSVFPPFDGWKEITVHCTGAGGGGLAPLPQNDPDLPPPQASWQGDVAVSDSAGSGKKACPRKGQVSFAVSRQAPGDFDYRISCSNGAFFTGSTTGFDQGNGVFEALAAHDLSITRTRSVSCTLQELTPAPVTVATDAEEFTCAKPVFDPPADDIVSTTGPRTGPSRPKPVVIVDPVLKCLPGQKLARGKCIDRPLVIACDRNERRVEGKCMKIPGVSIHCLPGYVQKGRECVKKPVIATACRQGEIRLNGKCVRKPSVSISCRKGFKLVGKACVRVPALTRTCPPGGKLVRGTCVGKKSAIRMSGPKTKQLIGRDGNNAMRLGTPSGKLRRAR